MQSHVQVKKDLDELTNFKDLVGSFEEISASRMRRVRGMVLQSRDFLYGLTSILKKYALRISHAYSLSEKPSPSKSFLMYL